MTTLAQNTEVKVHSLPSWMKQFNRIFMPRCELFVRI